MVGEDLQRRNSPILVGSILKDILHDSLAPCQRGHLTLIHQDVSDPALFKECLQPHVMHSQGRVCQFDYAFESHNITLNVDCAFTGAIVNSVYTRWPEPLNVVSAQGRQPAYLVWGEKTVKQT
jgi:hypothetical protein